MTQASATADQRKVELRWHLLMSLPLFLAAGAVPFHQLGLAATIAAGLALIVSLLFWVPATALVWKVGNTKDRMLFLSYPIVTLFVFLMARALAGDPPEYG